jgi:hypothetical protein
MPTLRAATFLTGRKSVFSNGARHFDSIATVAGKSPRPHPGDTARMAMTVGLQGCTWQRCYLCLATDHPKSPF